MFGEDTFLMDPDTDDLGTNVPSLAAWDPTNKDALLDVLMELFLYYKRHQVIGKIVMFLKLNIHPIIPSRSHYYGSNKD